jgi:hypothetical protein
MTVVAQQLLYNLFKGNILYALPKMTIFLFHLFEILAAIAIKLIFINEVCLKRPNENGCSSHNGCTCLACPAREYLREKYNCTIDLLFDWFGLVCFADKNKNCQLSYS